MDGEKRSPANGGTLHRVNPVRVPEALTQLAIVQEQVLHRDQIRRYDVSPELVRAQLQAQRWQAVGPVAVVLHNGPLTHEQKTWVAVLSAPGLVAVAGRHAARLHGLRNWPGLEPEVVVVRGDRFPALPFPVRVHESRRFAPQHVDAERAPSRTGVARSVIDAASWSPTPRAACGLLAAAVQQRLTTASRLARELRRAGQVRHCVIMRAVLADIEGGAQALSEVEFGHFLAAHGLPRPRRQVVRIDRFGKRRYLDVELEGPEGRILHIELDGALHLVVTTYWNDMERANELVLSGSRLLRFPSISWRLEPYRVADQIRRGLQVSGRQAA